MLIKDAQVIGVITPDGMSAYVIQVHTEKNGCWTVEKSARQMLHLHGHLRQRYGEQWHLPPPLHHVENEGDGKEEEGDEVVKKSDGSSSGRSRSITVVKHGAAAANDIQRKTAEESQAEKSMVNQFLHLLVHRGAENGQIRVQLEEDDEKLVVDFFLPSELARDSSSTNDNASANGYTVDDQKSAIAPNMKKKKKQKQQPHSHDKKHGMRNSVTTSVSFTKMEGHVSKLGKVQWSRRWAMVKSGCMYYSDRFNVGPIGSGGGGGSGNNGSNMGSKKSGGGGASGSGNGAIGNKMRTIPLSEVYRVQCTDSSMNNPFVFELVTQSETLRFSVGSEEERARWINAIIQEMTDREVSTLHDSMHVLFKNRFGQSREMLASHVLDTVFMTYFDGNVAAMRNFFDRFIQDAEKTQEAVDAAFNTLESDISSSEKETFAKSSASGGDVS